LLLADNNKIPEIQLNCLVVPNDLVGNIKKHHVVTIKINNEESIHSLRSQIKKEYKPRFDNIPISEFVVRTIGLNSDKVIACVNAERVLQSVNSGRQDGFELTPMSDISGYFSIQPSKKDIYVIIYLDTPPPQ